MAEVLDGHHEGFVSDLAEDPVAKLSVVMTRIVVRDVTSG